MKKYDHKEIEKKWQKVWEETDAFRTVEDPSKKKSYLLIEFPYPSGEGLHVGHPRPYVGLDVVARKRRAQGQNVLYPFGFDAFGLPTENYAIKTGLHPKIVTKKNTDRFREQVKSIGLSFDWSREIITTDPKYYKWTQWIFLQLYKAGLAYKAKQPINWCLNCKIGLANEEVIDGRCERCGGPTEKREKEQWMLAITKYADRLDQDLDTVDYLPRIKTQQKNWIGKSEGWEIDFNLVNHDEKITVFTTRPDTIYGATYLVLAPEHPFISKLPVQNKEEVQKYIAEARKKTEIERMAEGKEKTGVELQGVRAINPANNEEIPIWVADYVLGQYGTGAIMAVPAHDKRDFIFGNQRNIEIREVVSPSVKHADDYYIAQGINRKCYTGDGTLINSGGFTGMDSEDAKEKIAEFVGGRKKTTFKLRDWVFSRQRYWGEPIPMVFCKEDGWVAVPEDELPIELPDIENYKPTDTGESPLAQVSEWVNTTCPKCGGLARRETDVMPNWAGSSWYYLRYADPKNDSRFAGEDALNYWTPVDWYNGGMEHTTLHLLYSRFWHKFLYDQKLVPTSEPYAKRTSHGLILAEGGEKMSKSKGNVVNPDDMVERFGADTFRTYEMFMGPFEQSIAWSTDSMVGVRKFIEKVWRMREKVSKGAVLGPNSELESLLHKTIKKVTEDIEAMKFNTAVSSMMIFANAADREEKIPQMMYLTFLQLLAPFAPHVTEEIWSGLGEKGSIHKAPWPLYDGDKAKEKRVTIAIQVSGKVRGEIEADPEEAEEEVKTRAFEVPSVSKWLEGKRVEKVIYVKGRLLNIVVGNS